MEEWIKNILHLFSFLAKDTPETTKERASKNPLEEESHAFEERAKKKSNEKILNYTNLDSISSNKQTTIK